VVHDAVIFKPQNKFKNLKNIIHYRFVILIFLLLVSTSQAHHLVDLFYRLFSPPSYVDDPHYILLFELVKHEDVTSEIVLLSHIHLNELSLNEGDLLV
jgi:hypothetical protein